MSANELASQLSIAVTDGLGKINSELRGAIDDLSKIAPELGARAADAAKKAASYVQKGLKGDLEPDVARDCAQREIAALLIVEDIGVELAAQVAMKRAQKAIEVATEVGLTVIKVGLKAVMAAI